MDDCPGALTSNSHCLPPPRQWRSADTPVNAALSTLCLDMRYEPNILRETFLHQVKLENVSKGKVKTEPICSPAMQRRWMIVHDGEGNAWR